MLTLIRLIIMLINGGNRISNKQEAKSKADFFLELKKTPEKAPELIKTLVQRCWYINDDLIKNWNACLHTIPETFTIENYACIHRQFHENGALLIVTCAAQGQQGTLSGNVRVNMKHVFAYYVRHNTQTKYYEVMTQSYNDIEEKNVQSTFGRKLLEVLKVA